MPVPKYDELVNPTLQALHRLGGSASVGELTEEVPRVYYARKQERNRP
jgi:restriction system protein